MSLLNNSCDQLVCIFQRGAADGLNSLVPYADPDYYTHRGDPDNPVGPLPAIGVSQNDIIDVDGFFGLHPALNPLKAIYDNGDLAFVHATGIPHGSRSHFTAQDLVERGVDSRAGLNTGWLGRYMAQAPAQAVTAFRAVAISGNVPVSLVGADEPIAISNIDEFGFDQDIIDTGYPDVLNNLYREPVPFFAPAQAALTALTELQNANPNAITPSVTYPNTDLGKKLSQAGQMIKSSIPLEMICVDSGGWDHHENLPFYINQSLTELANALEAFYLDMGSRMDSITVLVITEFGRRVARNGSVGVDHGTGGLAYVMGGGVNGGQIIGSGANWPGLATQNLAMGEDLQITTDLRSVLSELLVKRMFASNTSEIFPEFTGPTDLNLFM